MHFLDFIAKKPALHEIPVNLISLACSQFILLSLASDLPYSFYIWLVPIYYYESCSEQNFNINMFPYIVKYKNKKNLIRVFFWQGPKILRF